MDGLHYVRRVRRTLIIEDGPPVKAEAKSVNEVPVVSGTESVNEVAVLSKITTDAEITSIEESGSAVGN